MNLSALNNVGSLKIRLDNNNNDEVTHLKMATFSRLRARPFPLSRVLSRHDRQLLF